MYGNYQNSFVHDITMRSICLINHKYQRSGKTDFRKLREFYCCHNDFYDVLLFESLRNFQRMDRWMIKKVKSTVVAVVHKKILIWFMKMML